MFPLTTKLLFTFLIQFFFFLTKFLIQLSYTKKLILPQSIFCFVFVINVTFSSFFVFCFNAIVNSLWKSAQMLFSLKIKWFLLNPNSNSLYYIFTTVLISVNYIGIGFLIISRRVVLTSVLRTLVKKSIKRKLVLKN